MKIGIDARFYGSLGKGLGRYTEKLLTYLERIPDDSHTYVVFLRQENFDEYHPTDQRFTKVKADYTWYGWQEQLFLPLLMRRHQLELVHFPHFNVPIFMGTPFVVTIHDLILLHFPTVKASELPPFLYWLKYLAYRVVIGLAVRRARSIITVSDFTKRDIESVYPAARGKTTATLEAADPYCYWLSPEAEQATLRSLGLRDENHALSGIASFVLYVGNAYPHKNLDLLLAVAPKFPETIFLCVGKEDYFYRSFQERVMTTGIANIRCVGYVDDMSLSVLYRRARAYISPSFYEGFGLPGLEAMNYGTPVVAARAGSLPEIYGDAARYFNPVDAGECVEALRWVFREINRTQFFDQAVSQVKRFSWLHMALETKRLYEASRSERY